MSVGAETELRVVGFGGGVQSTALMILAAQGRIPHRIFLFANVGSDSEHLGRLRYIRDIAAPFAAAHGLELVQLQRRKRDGTTATLHHEITRSGSRPELIPSRLTNGMRRRRSCTAEFKVRVVHNWLREHGASPTRPARVAIGFSTDEVRRVGWRRDEPFEINEFPLLDLGLSRDDCAALIAEHGLPGPDHSGCDFCPFHRLDRAARLERHINARHAAGRSPVWLSRYRNPLREVVRDHTPTSSEEDGPEQHDDGHCWT